MSLGGDLNSREAFSLAHGRHRVCNYLKIHTLQAMGLDESWLLGFDAVTINISHNYKLCNAKRP